ncbi:heterokaryon incompatibility protein-domain-containing protein, partial [Microdochium trichocladiopsis]
MAGQDDAKEPVRQSLPLRPAAHATLDLDRRCFRLLKLHPLSFPERQIQCCLEDHIFGDESDTIPPYEAVSYAWGSDAATHTIQVDGADFPVTRNLYTILQHLSPQGGAADTATRMLWIDAICIDQYNPHEQSHQVRQMRDIYASASSVIFYLGDPTADTNLVMTALGMLDSRITDFGRQHVDELLLDIIWDEVQTELREKFSAVAERQRNGLHELLQRSWFKRVWIIHEVGTAKQGVVQCGARTVSCETFVLSPALLHVDVGAERRDILDAMPTPKRASSWLSQDRKNERSLYRLLQKFRKAEATLDRDRIYALLGLCENSPASSRQPGMVVDYKKTDDDIIRDTIAHI